MADVPRRQPAVRVDGGGTGLRVVEVAEHHVVAAHQEFAVVPGRQRGPVRAGHPYLDTVDRAARGHRDGLGVVVGGADGDGAAALGEPVGGEHLGEEFGPHPPDEGDRDDGGAGHREP